MRTQQLVARPLQFRAAAPLGRQGPCQVSLHLRDLQHRQKLALFDPVADIHVDFLHEPRHFGVNVDFLKWPEFRRQHQLAGKIFMFCLGDRNGDRARRITLGLSCILPPTAAQTHDGRRSKPNNPMFQCCISLTPDRHFHRPVLSPRKQQG